MCVYKHNIYIQYTQIHTHTHTAPMMPAKDSANLDSL